MNTTFLGAHVFAQLRPASGETANTIYFLVLSRVLLEPRSGQKKEMALAVLAA
jgi:hypothetical protein